MSHQLKLRLLNIETNDPTSILDSCELLLQNVDHFLYQTTQREQAYDHPLHIWNDENGLKGHIQIFWSNLCLHVARTVNAWIPFYNNYENEYELWWKRKIGNAWKMRVVKEGCHSYAFWDLSGQGWSTFPFPFISVIFWTNRIKRPDSRSLKCNLKCNKSKVCSRQVNSALIYHEPK